MKVLWMNLLLCFTERSIQSKGMIRKKRNLISDINVVPYIDVMLVLLVIFMVAAPLMVQGISVNLPQVSSQALPVKQSDPLIISVRSNGVFFLEAGSSSDVPLDLDQLTVKLSKVINKDNDLQVVIRGDGEVKYEKIVLLMGVLQQLGSKNIGLITRPPSNK
jgi:biopolymer transport protein TolR